MEESDEENGCEICCGVQELLARPVNDLNDSALVSFAKEDVLTVINFFGKWLEFRDCRCFGSRDAYWSLHRLVRQIISTIVIPVLEKVSTRSEELSSPTTSSEQSSDGNASPNESESTEDGEDEHYNYRIIEFMATLFCDSFTLYSMYRKEYGTDMMEPAEQQQMETLNNRLPFPLLRMGQWCVRETKLLDVLEGLFLKATPATLQLKLCQFLVHIITQIRMIGCRRKRELQRVREAVIKYLMVCACEDGALMRETAFRVAAESMWVMGREEGELEEMVHDEPGLQLALKHLDSTALAPRLSGLNQLNMFVAAFNECLVNGISSDSLELYALKIADFLTTSDVVGKLFGPNTHLELLKQALTITDFLSTHGRISKTNIECIWAAAQKKECARQVFDLLSSVIKNMELSPMIHVYDLLKSLRPSEHTEMTLNLTYLIIETFWQVAIYRAHLAHQKGFYESPSKSDESTSKEKSCVSEGETEGESESGEEVVVGLESAKRKSEEWAGGEEEEEGEGEAPSKRLRREEGGAEALRVEVEMPLVEEMRVEMEEESPAKSLSSSSESELGLVEVGVCVGVGSRPRCSPRIMMQSIRPVARQHPRNFPPVHPVLPKHANMGNMMDFMVKNKKLVIPDECTGTDSEVSSDRVTSGSDRMVEFDDDDDLEMLSGSKAFEEEEEGLASPNRFRESEEYQEEQVLLSRRQSCSLGQGIFSPGSNWPVSPSMFRAVNSQDALPLSLSHVCNPGSTLLWDLLQMEDAEDCLGMVEEKYTVSHLLDLLERIPHCDIRKQFVCACVKNLEENRANVISLLLLTKILGIIARQEPRSRMDDETPDVIVELTNSLDILEIFFNNLKWYCDNRKERVGQSFLYSACATPQEFTLSRQHYDILWDSTFTDPEGGKTLLCSWLLNQLKARSHSLSQELIDYVIQTKLGDFDPESVSVTELALIETLLDNGDDRCLPLAWNIFLRNHSSTVSVKAMTSLSSYYLHSTDPKEAALKEEAFISLCMENLEKACAELKREFSDTCLTVINRGLLILKSHVDTFRRRYCFQLRMRELDNPTLKSHIRNNFLFTDSNPLLRLILQTSPPHQTHPMEVRGCSSVGELRAEIAFWWKQRQSAEPPVHGVEGVSTPILGALLNEGPLRFFHSGKELKIDEDEKSLMEVGIKDEAHILVCVGQKKGTGSITAGSVLPPLPPPPQSTPIMLLLAPNRWDLLMEAIQLLLHYSTLNTDERGKCLAFAQRAWEVVMLLPTSSRYCKAIDDILKLQVEKSDDEGSVTREDLWKSLLDHEKKHQLLYALQIIEMTVFPDKQSKFLSLGGFRFLIRILLSKTLLPAKGGWTDVTSLSVERHKAESSRHKDVSLVPSIDVAALEGIHLESLVVVLQNIIEAVCSDSNCILINSMKRLHVFKHASALLTGMMITDEKHQKVFLDLSNFDTWLQKIILNCCDPYLRQEVTMWLYRLCFWKNSQGKQVGNSCLKPILFSILRFLEEANAIPPIFVEDAVKKRSEERLHCKEAYGPSSKEYFWIATQFLEGLKSAHLKAELDNELEEECRGVLSKVSKEALRMIRERPWYEVKEHPWTDFGLSGLLTMQRAILQCNNPWKFTKDGQTLLRETWDLVFALPSVKNKEQPKCKSIDCRVAAFDLVLELGRGCDPNYRLLYGWITDQNTRTMGESLPWEYWPEEEKRSSCGLVGLMNLGATCYMATALQHLFMIPTFRRAILRFDLSQARRHSEILRELQRLFAFLLESERKAYDPRDFCKSYQMDNKPVNTGEQKDMTEFFTDLITKVEEMSGDLKQIVQQLFCGSMSNNVVSEDCTHVSQTMEQFYTVRCQVAEMKDIYASLDELTVADTLEGDNMYTCSQCNRKVRAKKQACFKELPQILSFNTMRYTFNMVTMMKEKVNTHFSFPLVLDMAPYMEETLFPRHSPHNPSPSSTYQLIGVTVHTGTAEGGHYYSFQKDPIDKEKWYWFNDSDVKLWDPNNLPNECFGGEHTRHEYDTGADRFLDLSFEKANSAYMLFYQRVEDPTEKVLREQMKTDDVVVLPKQLEEWIWSDNISFINDLMLFDHSYMQFVWQICSPTTMGLNIDTKELMCMSAKLSLRFVFETLIHAKEKPSVANWTEHLVKLLNACPEAGIWFLNAMTEDPRWPTEMLIRCPIVGCRQLFEKLATNILIQLGDREQALYLEPWKMDGCDNVDVDTLGEQSCVTRFIKVLLRLLSLPQLDAEIRQLTELFSLLQSFANGGKSAQKFLVLIGTIRCLINFYMTKTSQEMGDAGDDESDEELGLLSLMKTCVSRSLWLSPALERMVELIIMLLESTRLTDGSFCIPSDDIRALFGVHPGGYQFLMQQIRDGANVKTATDMIICVCKAKQAWMEKVLEDIFKTISGCGRDEQANPYFNVLTQLCSMPESEEVFIPLILERVWRRLSGTNDVTQMRPVPTLRWLDQNVMTCAALHEFLIDTKRLSILTERFLLKSHQFQIRYAAGECICSLIPSQAVKQQYYQNHRNPWIVSGVRGEVGDEAISTLHHILSFLLEFLPRVEPYGDRNTCGNHRLVLYFNTIRACLVSADEKRMLIPYLPHLWGIYNKCMHPYQEKMCANKQALFLLWFQAANGCNEVVEAAMRIKTIVDSYMLNYIVIDSDRETILYNKGFLTAYYGLAKLFCHESEQFSVNVMEHDNTKFALCNVAVRSDYRQAGEDIVGMVEVCCKHKNLEKVKAFKKKLWSYLCEIIQCSRSNFPLFLKVLRFLVDSPDDKVYLLENKVLNILSEVFLMIHRMYHEATACNMVGDLSEVLKRLADFFARGEQLQNASGMEERAERVINDWTKAEEVAEKLLTLLNSYIPPDLRKQSIICLTKVFKLLSGEADFISHVLTFLLKAHRNLRGCLGNCNPGPYFPKRGSLNEVPEKVNPPQPMLDMHLHGMLLEASKGVDVEYDSLLLEYFSPYHTLIDTVLRIAINLGPSFPPPLVQLIAEVSSLCGTEAIPLQLPLFPKLWLDVRGRSEGKQLQPLLDALVKTECFHVYIWTILTEEQSSLADPTIFQFFKTFISQVSQEFLTLERKRVIVENVSEGLTSFTQLLEEEKLTHIPSKRKQHCSKMIGSLRVLQVAGPVLSLGKFPTFDFQARMSRLLRCLNNEREKSGDEELKCLVETTEESLRKVEEVSRVTEAESPGASQDTGKQSPVMEVKGSEAE